MIRPDVDFDREELPGECGKRKGFLFTLPGSGGIMFILIT